MGSNSLLSDLKTNFRKLQPSCLTSRKKPLRGSHKYSTNWSKTSFPHHDEGHGFRSSCRAFPLGFILTYGTFHSSRIRYQFRARFAWQLGKSSSVLFRINFWCKGSYFSLGRIVCLSNWFSAKTLKFKYVKWYLLIDIFHYFLQIW